MKMAVIPEVPVEPALLAELASVLGPGEAIGEFVEAAIRGAVASRRVQSDLPRGMHPDAKADDQPAGTVSADAVLEILQAKLDLKKKSLDL